MDQEDRIDIYTIPPNFAEEGTMLSGRIKTRNAVETAILLAVLLPVLYSLQLPVKAKLYIGIIVLVPLTIFAVIGVQGESLSAFVGSFLRFLRRRRVLTVPDERYRLEQNRRREKREQEERKNREKKVRKSENRTGKVRGAKKETKQEAYPAADEKRTSGGAKRGKAKREKEDRRTGEKENAGNQQGEGR